MNRIGRFILLLLLLFTFCINNVEAQVTIGSESTPVRGALLDLKEYTPLVNNTTATKGLGLPRVKLTDMNSLVDIDFGGVDYTTTEAKQASTGLTVFNVNTDICIYPLLRTGVYTWDGERWNNLVAPSLEESLSKLIISVTDQEGNKLRARKFGDAGTWMIDNMYVTRYADSPDTYSFSVTTANRVGPSDIAMAYPGGDVAYFNADKGLGYLYSWSAAGRSGAVNSDGYVQGICPDGWHIPSESEWMDLEIEFINNTSNYSFDNNIGGDISFLNNTLNASTGAGAYRGTHGKAMSSCYTPVVTIPGVPDSHKSKTGYVAEMAGFDAHFPGIGSMGANLISYLHQVVHFWVSTSFSTNNMYRRGLSMNASDVSGVYRGGDGYKGNLYSVRCKKDD